MSHDHAEVLYLQYTVYSMKSYTRLRTTLNKKIRAFSRTMVIQNVNNPTTPRTIKSKKKTNHIKVARKLKGIKMSQIPIMFSQIVAPLVPSTTAAAIFPAFFEDETYGSCGGFLSSRPAAPLINLLSEFWYRLVVHAHFMRIIVMIIIIILIIIVIIT